MTGYLKQHFFYTLLLSCLLALNSCNSEQVRLNTIYESAGLELPDEFKVLRNETVEQGSFGSDFTIYIDLKFDEKNFQELKLNTLKPQDKGKWSKTEEGLHFSAFSHSEPSYIDINDKDRTLKFEFHHL